MTSPADGPAVTAVIPCHDDFDLLHRTLAALAVQDVPDGSLEVVCVDNNSTDGGIHRIVRDYWHRLPITVIQQPLLDHPYALCRARNLGIGVARGEWIWTLDSDCCPERGAARAILNAVGDGDGPLILTGERRFVDAGGISAADIVGDEMALSRARSVASASNYHLPIDRRFPDIRRLPDLPQPWDMMHGGNTAFRKADAVRVGGYDEAFDGTWGYEDDEFAHRIITVAGAVPRFVKGMVVYHQEPAENRKRSDRPDKANNPNWHRVCSLIPGYREYKLARFSAAGVRVTV